MCDLALGEMFHDCIANNWYTLKLEPNKDLCCNVKYRTGAYPKDIVIEFKQRTLIDLYG